MVERNMANVDVMAERNKPRSLPDKLTKIPNTMLELLKNDIDCPMKIIVEKPITNDEENHTLQYK